MSGQERELLEEVRKKRDEDEARWLTERTKGIGSTDAPAIMGKSPWKSPLQVYAEKVGAEMPAPKPEAQERMNWGKRLQRAIADGFAEDTGRIVTHCDPYAILRSQTYPFAQCSLDAIQTDTSGRQGVLEVKAVGAHNADDWGEDAPLHYQIQLQHQLLVTGYEWGTIVALLGGQRMVWIDYRRHADFLVALIRAEEQFWHRVEQRDPPQAVSDLDRDAVKLLFPADRGSSVNLPSEFVALDEEREAVSKMISEASKRKEALDARIMQALGDNTYGHLGNGMSYKWASEHRKEYHVKAQDVRVLRRVKTPKE